MMDIENLDQVDIQVIEGENSKAKTETLSSPEKSKCRAPEEEEEATADPSSTKSAKEAREDQVHGPIEPSVDPFADWKPTKGQWLMILCFMIVSLVVALDATILVPILPVIAESFHGSANDAFWTGTSYLLTSATFQPFIVALSDVFGRKQALLACISLFTLGTIICCLSQNFTQLLVGRSIQGIGGGGINNLPNVIFTDFVPLRQRPTYNAFNQMAWAVGTVTGPAIGGLFADHKTWRWAFYINFPFCAIGLAMIPLVVRLKADRPSLKERLLYIDWIGAILFIGSTVSFLYGVTSGGTKYAWSDFRTILPLVLGILCLLGTLIWERLGAPNPFLRLSVFNSVSTNAAFGAAVMQGILLFCQLYYIPLFFETARNFSPTMAGVALIPTTAALVPVSVITGTLITRFGRFRWAMYVGEAMTILSTGLLILFDPSIATGVWVVLLILVGLGHGLVLMSINFCIQALVAERDSGYAAAMYTFLRTFGMCIGVAVGGTVFENRLVTHLAALRLNTDVAKNAAAFVTTLRTMPVGSAQRMAYGLAYAQGFRNVVQALVGVAAVGGFLTLWIKRASMDRALESEHRIDGRMDKSNVLSV